MVIFLQKEPSSNRTGRMSSWTMECLAQRKEVGTSSSISTHAGDLKVLSGCPFRWTHIGEFRFRVHRLGVLVWQFRHDGDSLITFVNLDLLISILEMDESKEGMVRKLFQSDWHNYERADRGTCTYAILNSERWTIRCEGQRTFFHKTQVSAT